MPSKKKTKVMPAKRKKKTDVKSAALSLPELPYEVQSEIYSYFITPWSLHMFRSDLHWRYMQTILAVDYGNCASITTIPGRALAIMCRVMHAVVRPLQYRAFDGRLFVGNGFRKKPDTLFDSFLMHVTSLYHISVHWSPETPVRHLQDNTPVWCPLQFSTAFLRNMPRLSYVYCVLINQEHKIDTVSPGCAIPRREPTDKGLVFEVGKHMRQLLQKSRNSANRDGIVVADCQLFNFRSYRREDDQENLNPYRVALAFHVRYQNKQYKVVGRAMNWNDTRYEFRKNSSGSHVFYLCDGTVSQPYYIPRPTIGPVVKRYHFEMLPSLWGDLNMSQHWPALSREGQTVEDYRFIYETRAQERILYRELSCGDGRANETTG